MRACVFHLWPVVAGLSSLRERTCMQQVRAGVGCADRGLSSGATLACFRTAGEERVKGYAALHALHAFPSLVEKSASGTGGFLDVDVPTGFTKARDAG